MFKATGKFPVAFLFFESLYSHPCLPQETGMQISWKRYFTEILIIHVLFERHGWEQWGRNENGFCFLNISI
jgi:hypothetical protein